MGFIKSQYNDGFFNVNSKNGFLPEFPPIEKLNKPYQKLQEILDNMPVSVGNKSGYLDIPGRINLAVDKLPNLITEVSNEQDIRIIQALFRGYSFLASAFALEPSFQYFRKTGKYGKANNILPKQIAQPFVEVSKKLDVFPWLDYHYAYSLGNYKKIDKNGDHTWSNLDMCVRFSGKPDEVGFIMLHVDINQHSPALVGSVIKTLQNLKLANDMKIIKYLKQNYETMKIMNHTRKQMWKASRWNHYNDFRVFIMGVKGNDDLFGDGILYSGVWDEPKKFRGQTGAQDDIIPMEDIFSGVIKHYPKNELTKYLMDLRSYRPKCIQNFFTDLENSVQEIHENGISGILNNNKNTEGLFYLLGILEEIYHFRNGHWQFVQKYIMANTKYAKATGGTPIISWLPNQMKAVMKEMDSIIEIIDQTEIKFQTEIDFLYKKIKNSLSKKKKLLEEQLKIVNKKVFSAKRVFDLNKEYDLEDN